MGLQQLWFVILAVLFLGFFILEGFDFGVGMLMAPLGRIAKGDREAHRRAVLNTIGPVWDGNEVWLITAGASMFAAFPNWYATVFSALYLPLLAILFGMIVRAVAIEWRGKIDDMKWRAWADAGIAAGSWLPGILWGWPSPAWFVDCPSMRTTTCTCRLAMSSTPTPSLVESRPVRYFFSTARYFSSSRLTRQCIRTRSASQPRCRCRRLWYWVRSGCGLSWLMEKSGLGGSWRLPWQLS